MCLSFGAMIPDIEIFIMLPFSSNLMHARGPMHSYLGAFTVDILAALIVAYFFIPPIGRWFKKHTKNKWHMFAGVDVTRAPTDPMWAVLSALIGTVSHVTLDVFTHEFNPIYWPYALDRNINILLFGDGPLSSLVFIIPLFIIVIAMLLMFWTKPSRSKVNRA